MQEKRIEQKLVRFVEKFHEVDFIERETSSGMYVVRRETTTNSSNNQTCEFVA